MKPKKVKKCKACKAEFTPFNSMAKACSPKCALELVELDKKKKARKDRIDYNKKNKPVMTLKKEAQAAFNEYVRVRDYHLPCISSGKPDNHQANEFDCGHYRSVGSSNHLRFHLHNAHKQSKHDNNYLSGNIVEYRKGLIERIGLEKVEALENNNDVKPMNKEYFERVKRIFNKKTRMRKRRLGID